MSADPIVHFNGSYSDLEKLIVDKANLCVVDFFGTWCGPCKRLGGLLPAIAKEYQDVTFIKVDVDQNGEASQKFGVSSIPHVAFVKAEGSSIKTLGTVIGCDVEGIKAKINALK